MKAAILHLTLVGLVVQASAGNWGHWRGPEFNGSSGDARPPVDFSRTNGVKWVAALPGPSAATPIIWGDKVFLSSGDDKAKSLRAMCIERGSGKLLWNNEVPPHGYNQDDKSNFASPSPATDGKTVVFLYGNGELIAFDFAGKKLWERDLQKDYGQWAYQWTYGASPTIFDGKLYVQVLQRDEPVRGRGAAGKAIDSYLLALEPASGKEIWRQVRPSEAHGESHEAYSTPIPFTYKGRTEILITGGDCVTGHDYRTGAELWRWGSWNPSRISHWRLVPSPVTGEGIVLVCAPKNSPVYGCKAGAKGNQDDSVLAWKSQEREISSDVATPLFYKGKFYVVNGEHHSICRVEPATGKADWVGELEARSKTEASPTAAGDKIYFQNFRGEVFIVAAGSEFKLLKTISMGDEGDDQLRSSLPVVDNELFVRTGHKLYCVAQAKGAK
jgi:outer membrane protein assembly factor BamB